MSGVVKIEIRETEEELKTLLIIYLQFLESLFWADPDEVSGIIILLFLQFGS